MDKRVTSLVIVATLMLLMVPLVLFLLGKDRYSFTITQMDIPNDTQLNFFSKNSRACEELKKIGKSERFSVHCNGVVDAPLPGNYNIVFNEETLSPMLHVDSTRTLVFDSNKVDVLLRLLQKMFPVYQPKVIHSREVNNWCFTMSSNTQIEQGNITKVIQKLQEFFPLHYRFSELTDKQHSSELEYPDMNCLYRFSLELSNEQSDLEIENYKGKGPLNEPEKSLIGYFRYIFEIPSLSGETVTLNYSKSSGFLSFEMDNILRQLSIEQVTTSISLIKSFVEITSEEKFVPIPQSLAVKASDVSERVARITAEKDLKTKFELSQELVKDAHSVAYSEDFFAILFFPIEHKIACLLPLFGPVTLLFAKTLFQTYT
ncbi:hypothetical protein EIN_492690 [Entamoeba invadens IP1]|uniref:GPI transamidase component PIG-S n=1 Tax=Entamoeba invadens IP1 TaxID=370355 RepID=A0A0A1U4A5_ENTIV|nr:hypothetical protein EIN_492690 [Entamoeba invadens IP1]ELP89000.1 hypothetical protein EIN_492690 [Entamoeba invadens IP1]|eukprot:XP_004255771.1 hypothetical protein EIN_492690 [Entamoeba invadens IP1]